MSYESAFQALTSDNRRARSLAALRLGRVGRSERPEASAAVDALLAAIPGATDEVCSLIDALGVTGDARAIPVARQFAARKLLSRRRSGVEALRNLGDAEGLAEARERAIAGLEEEVRATLSKLDLEKDYEASVAVLAGAVTGLENKRRGRAADVLYEIGTPLTVAATKEILRKLPFDRPYVWRYAKSVLKRAMLRRDHDMLGWIAYRIEVRALRSYGTKGTLKSGRDGKKRVTPVFNKTTQRYVRRRVWRHLTLIARHWPEEYPAAAAEAIVHYVPANAETAKGFYGEFSRAYLLNRVLWSAGPRLQFKDRSLRFRFVGSHMTQPEPGDREEPYPELWDAQPRAYLRLLAAARLPEVQDFAVDGVFRHDGLIQQATGAELVGMLEAGHPGVIALGVKELEGRFDPNDPDWSLLERLVIHEDEQIRGLGLRWLADAAPLWAVDLERTVVFLTTAFPDVRARAVTLAVPLLAEAPATVRAGLAERILTILKEPEEPDGAHAALADLASRALLVELGDLLTMPELLELITDGSTAAKTVAGALLGQIPDALEHLGLPRVLGFAQNEVRAVRGAAQAMIRGAAAELIQDPGLLFLLVESDWDDTREVAFAILREHGSLATLGLNGLVGLCDSNRVDVQDMGRDLVLKHLSEVEEPGLLLQRISEHPHRNMRRFALDLAEEHLETGVHPLAALERFFRTGLFDLSPERDVKRRIVDLLTRRGATDAEQAAVAVRVLGDAVRVKGVEDFEQALVALTRLRLAFPEVDSLVQVGEA